MENFFRSSTAAYCRICTFSLVLQVEVTTRPKDEKFLHIVHYTCLKTLHNSGMTPGCLKADLNWAVAALIISLSGSNNWDKIVSIAQVINYTLLGWEMYLKVGGRVRNTTTVLDL